MNATTITQPRQNVRSNDAARVKRPDGVRFLQWFGVMVMVFPSTTVVGPIGSSGYPACLIGVYMLVVYSAVVFLGMHNPLRHRHPIQTVLCLLWIAALASYVLMDRAVLDATQIRGADRMLIQIAMYTGAALVAAEWIHSLEDVRRILRAVCWAAVLCGIIAVFQYAINLDLSVYIRGLPGFRENHLTGGTMARGSLNRATGLAISPIELGVAAGMLIPIGIYMGLYDAGRSKFMRWTPVAVITMMVGVSVSRSAIVAVIVGFGLLLVLLPPMLRAGALCAVPFAVAGAFMTAHGLIGTLTGFFSQGSSDSSVQYRLHDYPVAEKLWMQAPWFGHGGGTYLPSNDLDIFDNQYLTTTIEWGAVGAVVLCVFLVAPAIAALIARSRSRDPELRILCAALAGAGLAMAFCSLTFDSLSFPMAANLYALVVGLIGACWRLAMAEQLGPAASELIGNPSPALTARRQPGSVWPGRPRT